MCLRYFFFKNILRLSLLLDGLCCSHESVLMILSRRILSRIFHKCEQKYVFKPDDDVCLTHIHTSDAFQ